MAHFLYGNSANTDNYGSSSTGSYSSSTNGYRNPPDPNRSFHSLDDRYKQLLEQIPIYEAWLAYEPNQGLKKELSDDPARIQNWIDRNKSNHLVQRWVEETGRSINDYIWYALADKHIKSAFRTTPGFWGGKSKRKHNNYRKTRSKQRRK